MKIAHVITRFVRGGADENTLLSCNAQAEAGHDVLLISGRDRSQALMERVHPKVVVRVAASLVREIDLLRDLRALGELRTLIRDFQPDIVHTHTSKAGILGRLAAWSLGERGIVHGVHILPFLNVGPLQRFVYLSLERLVAPPTAAFVNVSSGMREACEDVRLGLGRHHVVPSGMDVDRFWAGQGFSTAELAGELGLAETQAGAVELIVMAAALEPRKRIFEFLDVFAKVAAERPLARFVVLGEGFDRARIEARAAALGVSERVHLVGFRSDPERWMKTAAVCVLSSEREGLPRVLVQYALCGRPIVTTRLPGVDHVLRDGVTSFLTPVDDVSAMAGPLLALLEDPALAQRMAAATAALDLSAWSVRSMVDQLDAIYLEVLERHGGTNGARLAFARNSAEMIS